MKKYFAYQEVSEGYQIVPIHKMFGEPYIEGSFSLIAARFCGMDYVTFLHYCEAWGARLIGKGQRYIKTIWQAPDEDFLNFLNQRANEIASRINVKELSY